jgi:outer membrane protein W
MDLAALILAAALAAGPSTPDARGTSRHAEVSWHAAQRRVEGERRQTGARPHTVGLGGQLAFGTRGGGAGARLFASDRFGVNVNALWYRNGSRFTTTPQGSTFAALPSLIWILTKPDPTREIDFRPYVGGGVNYVRSTRPVTSPGGQTIQTRSGVGAQAFAGLEMTFRDADWMTVSIEGIYHELPVNYVDASIVGGFNYVLAFHFYLK